MGVVLAGWCPASKVDEVEAYKSDEQPTSEHLRSRNLPASAVESVNPLFLIPNLHLLVPSNICRLNQRKD
jgi:hypothetical protein